MKMTKGNREFEESAARMDIPDGYKGSGAKSAYRSAVSAFHD